MATGALNISDGDNRQFLDTTFSTGPTVFGGSRALGTGSSASTDMRATTTPAGSTGQTVDDNTSGILKVLLICGSALGALFALVAFVAVLKPKAPTPPPPKKKGRK